MKKKIFGSIFLAVIITLFISAFLITDYFYASAVDHLKSEIENDAKYLQAAIESEDLDAYEFISQVGEDSSTRITLIQDNGTVVYDNVAIAGEMENHSDRPEVIAALEKGYGEAERLSKTLDQNSIYYAVNLDNGYILRIGTDVTNAFGVIKEAIIWLVFISISVLLLALIVAHFLTKSIIRPINEIDLDSPLNDHKYDEIAPLLRKVESQKKEIQRQISTVREKQHEFNYITENMNEGLLILGEHGKVLSANESAIAILGNTAESYVGLCRDINFLKAVEGALNGKAVSTKMERNNKIYKITASPVATPSNEEEDANLKNKKNNFGTIVFIVDISDSELSEKMRREFSANVSHELKTPLTSIMGYAEIISNGIAKIDDIPEFANKIRLESDRLLKLIEDIINLSKLDEENIMEEFQDVELSKIIINVISSLEHKAKQNDIKINCNCENVIINGFPAVLEEMVFNLIDNAINYNKKSGSIDIILEKTTTAGTKAVLTVRDTGVGIAPEFQRRVFERFYRVDKSHSKATGGTGLGLSIVKHGAVLHKATIELKSKINEGTEITIRF